MDLEENRQEKDMKKTISITLALVMVLSMMLTVGCQVATAPTAEGPAASSAPADSAQTQAADDDAIVAKVGDVEITLAQYKQLFEQYSYYYSMFGMDVTSDAETLAQFHDMVCDALLEKEIVKYQAEKNKLDTLNEDQQADVKEQAENMMSEMKDQFKTMAEEAKASDDTIDVDTYVNDMIADEAEFNTGKAMTPEEYSVWLQEEASVEHLRDNLMNEMCKDVKVNDEDVQAWYDEALASDKETYTQTPADFKAAEEGFICNGIEGGTLPVTYAPEGYSHVMDMLVMPKADVNELYPEYAEKTAKQDELKAEYGELAFEDAQSGNAANKTRLSAIISEYNQLKAETDKMMEEAGKEAKTTIEEAYAKLQEGATFESLQPRYTENESCLGCESLMMDGLLINPDANDGSWSDECINAFKALKVGEYSPIFQDADGYHILYYVNDVKAGERPLSDIAEDVKESLLEDARLEEWQNILNAWMTDGSVEVHEEVYRQVGA